MLAAVLQKQRPAVGGGGNEPDKSGCFASAVDSMMGSMFLPKDERASKLSNFVSALDAAQHFC